MNEKIHDIVMLYMKNTDLSAYRNVIDYGRIYMNAFQAIEKEFMRNEFDPSVDPAPSGWRIQEP